jgi:DNA-binding MarR family transcriptional regulator
MGYALLRDEIGINTTIAEEECLLSVTKAICKYYATPKELLYKYIPKVKGVRSTSSYNVLIFIYCTPASTELHIAENIHSDQATIKRCVSYLKLLGYIKPFNSYKQEKTWLITTKGKSVLAKLLDY